MGGTGGVRVVPADEASIEDKRPPPSDQTQARRWPPNLVVTRAATLITTRRRLAAVLLALGQVAAERVIRASADFLRAVAPQRYARLVSS